MPVITIIGSRETPKDKLEQLTSLSKQFSDSNWVLRSGGAPGADTAGELGFRDDLKEIYLPWARFNGNNSTLIAPAFENWHKAVELTLYLHPSPGILKTKPSILALMGRNIYQILGRQLNSPTDIVLCWTLNGLEIGGTAQALRVCNWYKEETGLQIPIVNLGNTSFEDATVLLNNYKREIESKLKL
jgi:hypothetical protein